MSTLNIWKLLILIWPCPVFLGSCESKCKASLHPKNVRDAHLFNIIRLRNYDLVDLILHMYGTEVRSITSSEEFSLFTSKLSKWMITLRSRSLKSLINLTWNFFIDPTHERAFKTAISLPTKNTDKAFKLVAWRIAFYLVVFRDDTTMASLR
jgi:hypothetical protein